MTKPADKEDYFEILPTDQQNKMFYYKMKSYRNPARINVSYDGNPLFLPEASSFASVDFGRGNLPYKTGWIWASAMDENIALNFGGGIASSNAKSVGDLFWLDGKVIKLQPVEMKYEDINLLNGVYLRTFKSF